jgi:ABC-type glycerol-3-phosphate transport system substrate-binding protein
MWTRAAVLALATLTLAACGGDEGGGGGGDAPTAASFTGCFELAGFEAVKPKPREESVLAFQAKSKGYAVEPVNVQRKGMLTPHAFLVFFESEAKAKEAMEELNATSFGEVPPQQQRGPAVIGYGDRENRASVEPAIADCL